MAIVQVPVPFLGVMWLHVAAHLLRGLGAAGGDLEATVEDLLSDRARLWVILEGDKVLGVFLTAIVKDGAEQAVDVYALSGEEIMRWGKQISEVMADYAKAKGCRRILFQGRRGLLRAYDGAEIIGEVAPGVYQFARAV